MALLAHYDLEFHQMDVKMAFLNGDMLENVYMTQHKGFAIKEKEHMGCHKMKFIYELKQASRQWYLKFNETIRNFGFKENEDDILLASSDVNLLLETKRSLSSNFDIKDLGEALFVVGIEVHQDRRKGVLGLSQKAYLEKF
jgi:hypothetical protein